MTRRWRTRAAIFAVITQWVALALGLGGYLLLDYAYQKSTAMSPSNPLAVIMLLCALIAGLLAGIFAIISVIRDRGRIRAGAALIVSIPLATGIYLVWASHSTLTGPDIWTPLTLIGCVVALIVATLLIALPEHLGVG